MSDETTSPLQRAVRDAIAGSEKTRDHFDSLLRKRLGTTGKPLYDIDRGKSRRPAPETLRAIEDVLGLAHDSLVDLVHPPRSAPEPDQQPTVPLSLGETALVSKLDLRLPMGDGATIDDYVEETPLIFDLGYIRSFTPTPPSRLRIAHGVGDSMLPTLNSNDMVWIDSTQRILNQQDRVWAVSINGAAAIKRLRSLKGGRVMIISDNPTIGDYEVDADELLIGGRVIRFARDL